MLTTPSYIASAVDYQKSISYEWHDATAGANFAQQIVPLQKKLDKLFNRASAGLAAASAEWILYRLDAENVEPQPHALLEAAWAALVDRRYLSDQPLPEHDGWVDARRGPLWSMMLKMKQILERAHGQESIAYDVVCMSNLAQYVLPSTKQFKAWHKLVLDRLLTLYSLQGNDLLGSPVPREAFDPAFYFKPEMADELIGKFIEGLDFQNNPYLQRP